MTTRSYSTPVFRMLPVIFLLIAHVFTGASPAESSRLSSIKIVPFEKIPYVSVVELAHTFQLAIDYDPLAQSMTLKRGANSLTVHNRSRMARYNGSLVNLMAPSRLFHGALYAPVSTFITIFSGMIPGTLEWDDRKWTITSPGIIGSVRSITYDERIQGTLIRIGLTESLVISDTLNSNGSQKWLDVTLKDGVCYTDSLVSTPPSGMVRSVRTFRGNDGAVISFLVSNNMESYDIKKGKDNKEILISLRAKRSASHAAAVKESPGTTAWTPFKPLGKKDLWIIDTVVIDAGHGGKDPGAIGPKGTKEKDIVLSIAKEIKKIADKRGDVKVILTRDKDELVPLHRRATIAIESNGKLFVSIHANSARSKYASGMEVFFLSGAKTEDAKRVAELENKSIEFEDNPSMYSTLFADSDIPDEVKDTLFDIVSNVFLKDSQHMCAILLDSAVGATRQKYRGVKQAGFIVLNRTQASMPSVLFEIGFISNPNEEKLIRRASHRKRIAKAIYDAVIEFKKQAEHNLIKVSRSE